MRKRFSAILCAAVFFIAFAAPVYAVEYNQVSNLYHWLPRWSVMHDVIGYTTGLVCTKSDDGYHHATTYQQYFGNGYYQCV